MQLTINKNNFASKTSLSIVIMLFILLAGTSMAGAQTKKWTGEGKTNEWRDPGNWDPKKIPTDKDDIEIPGDAGKIIIRGVNIKVKSLHIKKSKKKCGTIVTSATKGGNLFIRAVGGDIRIGKNSKIKGGDGNSPLPANTGQNGGFVRLEASGNVINMGKVIGGKGGNGLCPGRGGNVTVNGGSVDNRCGCLIGGEGGSFFGGPPGAPGAGAVSGNRGGNVFVRSKKAGKSGTVKGGKSGVGFDGTRRKSNFGNDTWRSVSFKMSPLEQMHGNKVTVESPASMDLSGIGAQTFIAAQAIYLNAHGTDIDLRGIAPGTPVFDAPDVCFDGNLILDPGVAVATLCTGNVHFGLCADRPVQFVLLPEDFTTGHEAIAPHGWATATQVGSGFHFQNTTGISLPPFAGDCGVAIIDADENGPNPDQATLDTPLFSTVGITGNIVLEWDQWHQPSNNSTVEVFVIEGNNTTPVFFNNQGTAPNDRAVIDITNLVQDVDDALIRFQYTATAQSWWILDNVEIRVIVDTLHGKPPVAGVSLFDINDAKNINGVPVFFQEDGPYFATANTNQQAHLHFEGPPNSVIFLFGGFVMPGATIDPLFGLLDLDNPFVLDSGFNNGPFSSQFQVQFNGQQDIFLPISPASAGTTLGLQATFLHQQSGQIEVANAVQLDIVN